MNFLKKKKKKTLGAAKYQTTVWTKRGPAPNWAIAADYLIAAVEV